MSFHSFKALGHLVVRHLVDSTLEQMGIWLKSNLIEYALYYRGFFFHIENCFLGIAFVGMAEFSSTIYSSFEHILLYIVL